MIKDSPERRRWSLGTKLKLIAAGWRPGRDSLKHLSLPKSLDLFPAAQKILTEFGGLALGTPNEHVNFDPGVGEDVADQIRKYERKIGLRLYPLGFMEHQDRHYLLVDERGIIYTLIDELEPLASSFDRAIEYLVWRRKDPHEAAEDLRSVDMAGKVWRLEN